MTGLLEDIPRFVTANPAVVSSAGESEVTTAQFCFGEDFIGFRGHFPGNPVLPGIAQIMLAQYTATRGRSGQLARVVKCKFTSNIKPLDNVEVQTTATSTEGASRYKATVTANGTRCATMVFDLEY
ncbi:hypothetical protein TUM12370_07340 [Salmonella enterica subsp. enterica serovar Choleraesuis]|nr:hypothetical protein TUM12370_07340 [Salmonella enterica subsp. enterica serovar Choleraesuis]